MAGVEAEVVHVTDYREIAAHGVMSTPGPRHRRQGRQLRADPVRRRHRGLAERVAVTSPANPPARTDSVIGAGPHRPACASADDRLARRRLAERPAEGVRIGRATLVRSVVRPVRTGEHACS